MHTSARSHRLALEHIAEARRAIDAPFRDTPQFVAESLGSELGCRVLVKIETLNPIRSFKARGALYFVSKLRERRHLTCATAGNFGQGMAYAARKHGLPITIFTSLDASPLKVARMRALGAEVRLQGNGPDEAHEAAMAYAASHGALLVEDGREPAIAEGAGTIGDELMRWPERLDTIVVPLGDGALLGGAARWIKAHAPRTQMIGVCAAGAPAMRLSWVSGNVCPAETSTIADGIEIRTPFAEAVHDLQGLVDDIVLVEDATLIAAMKLAHRELGLVLEPSGAAGLAALLTHRERFQGTLVATVLTGGNLTDEQMNRWLA